MTAARDEALGAVESAEPVGLDDGAPTRLSAARSGQAVSLSFFRFDGWRGRAYAISRMATARAPLARDPDIGFYRLFGTGTGEGFSLSPNLGVWAVLATWPTYEHAKRGVADRPVFRGYRARANESWTVYLGPYAARGRWGGVEPFAPSGDRRTGERPAGGGGGPIAVLTRATIKTRHALAFWRRTPGISANVRDQSTLAFKIGMGESPGRKQVTFSIWRDAEAMRRFAYGDGPHAAAVRAVRDGDWFREELYARFRVLGTEGSWGGEDPLT